MEPSDSLDLTDLSNKNTTTAKTDEDHSACTYYNVLDSVNRNVATLNNESVCISEGNKMPCCDKSGVLKKTPDWKGQGWYRYYCLCNTVTRAGNIPRLMGAAGTKIPDAPVGERRCGTHLTTWMSGWMNIIVRTSW